MLVFIAITMIKLTRIDIEADANAEVESFHPLNFTEGWKSFEKLQTDAWNTQREQKLL